MRSGKTDYPGDEESQRGIQIEERFVVFKERLRLAWMRGETITDSQRIHDSSPLRSRHRIRARKLRLR